jgi:hypothetical protein
MIPHPELTTDRLPDGVMNIHAPAGQQLDLADEEPSAALPPSEPQKGADENVFQILGRQARTRTLPQLWTTTIGGLLGLLWWEHPGLSWLAAACAATAAYGVWGLLDRAAHTRIGVAEPCRDMVEQLIGLRNFIAVLGTGAALWAVLSFMAAALGNWHH